MGLMEAADGGLEGFLHRTERGNPFPRDVECCTMRGSCDRQGQTTMDGDTAFEAEELGGYLALVVIHSNHGVEPAVAGSQENGIRWERTAR